MSLTKMIRDDLGRYAGQVRAQRPELLLAKAARLIIQRRTARGIDKDGNTFRPYARSTARRKGRRSPVTLADTGNMMRRLRVRGLPSTSATAQRAEVAPGTKRDQRVMGFHVDGTRHMPVRDPMGITRAERQALYAQAAGQINRVRVPSQGAKTRIQVRL